jgi:hypothetical protein
MKLRNHKEKRELTIIGIFATLSGVSAGIFISGMIANGKGAVRRYDALMAVDQAGGDVSTTLNDLRQYIYSHMNTEIGGPNGIYPPIQLKGTYDRLKSAEDQRVKETNDSLYNEAQEYCERTGNQGFSGRNRLDCINAYIDQNGAKPKEIEEALYKYDFVSPRWSPDVAGFGLLFLLLFASITFIKVGMYLRTRYLVHLGN